VFIDFETAFYTTMVTSIVAVSWLEALAPLERGKLDLEHLARNLTIWFIAFVCADFLVAHYWIDIQSVIGQQSFGIFYWLSVTDKWALAAIGVVIIDMADYLYHRISHHSRFLWRFHAVHHTDTTVDISTSLRSHPVDLVMSNFWKFAFALAFGIPIWVIGFRELFIFPLIFLQHANISLPPKLEGALSKVLIMPTIHRLHHSIARQEQDSNYGGFLIFWDKLFGSFKKPAFPRPETYGVEDCANGQFQTIDGMLLTPFRIYRSESTSKRSQLQD